jgi:toxic protein SymE
MAATNFKPEFTVCKTESDAFTGMIENRELVRKNSARRLHGNQTNAAPVHPRGNAAGQCSLLRTVCAHRHEISSSGRRLVNPWALLTVCRKIRAMKDCIVITPTYKRIMGMPGRYECGEYK